MDQDSTCLQRFLATRDEQAFAELVRRHVDMVYSAARRQVRDDAAAQDVTQQVFVLLAAKARSIRSGEAAAGWLLATTRYVALNSFRTEQRRRRHEREAAVMHEQQQQRHEDAPQWSVVAPLLDEVVAKLKREDRDALALRYFQGRSVADVAAAMGVSQEAAQKRLSRAVERMRELFARRGVHTSADALSSVMMANALIAAPAALGSAVAGSALTTATTTTTAATATATSGAGKGAMTIMAIAKTKIAAAAVAGVLLAGVTGTIAYQQIRTPGGRSRQVKVDPAATMPAPAPAPTSASHSFMSFDITAATNPAWRTAFDQIYMLAPGETMKRVPPPFVPERLTYYHVTAGTAQVQAIPDGPDIFLLSQGPQGLTNRSMTFGGSGEDVRSLLREIVGIAPQQTDLPRAVLMRVLPGDWVVRDSSPVADRMAAFTQLLSKETGGTYRSEIKPLERDVIVITGTYAYHPLAGVAKESRGETIHFYVGQPDKKPSGFTGTGGNLAAMFAHLEDLTGRQVILETKLPTRGANSFRDHGSMEPYHRKEMDPATMDTLLANVAKQTSFQLKRERRVVPTWVFTEAAK